MLDMISLQACVHGWVGVLGRNEIMDSNFSPTSKVCMRLSTVFNLQAK